MFSLTEVLSNEDIKHHKRSKNDNQKQTMTNILSANTTSFKPNSILGQLQLRFEEAAHERQDLNWYDFVSQSLLNYGCWCDFNMAGDLEVVLGDRLMQTGDPVDEIDGICKKIMQGYQCILADLGPSCMDQEYTGLANYCIFS